MMAKKIPAAMRKYHAEMGRKGGKIAGKTLTAEQRSARAKAAAAARWKKDQAK
jgi:hypothetical protein